MIWQNPWAWVGLAALALPVVIHLLSRGDARRVLFPSLRFLPPSHSLPTRRRRVRDPLVLAVRLGILAAAVGALAQPLLLSRQRTTDAGKRLARAIIVDTSASMHRATPAGENGILAARREARRIASEAQSSIVIETAVPARAIAGALAWIERQRSRAEVVVVSDFQTGAVAVEDLATIPIAVGVSTARIDVAPATQEVVARTGDVETLTQFTRSAGGLDVEWTSRAAPGAPAANIALLVGAAERTTIDAISRAATAAGVRGPFDTTRAVAIVYPTFERRAELLRDTMSLRAPWMVDVAASLRSDSMLAAAASLAEPVGAADTSTGLVVARNSGGKPVVVARDGRVDGHERMLVLALVHEGSLTSAALIAATMRAVSLAPVISELEPSSLSDSALRSLQRAPSIDLASPADSRSGLSDGRWLWMLALALLAIETVLRRARPRQAESEIRHDRAA